MASTFPRFAGDTTPPFVLRLCQAMHREGWASVVLAPHAAGLATRDHLEGVECQRFRYAPPALERLAYGGGMLANIRAARWLWLVLPFYMLALLVAASALLVRRKITVVHAHWIIPQGLVAVMLRRLFFRRRLRVVVTAHGSDLHADMGGLARRLLQWTMREADVLSVVSPAMQRLAMGLGVPEQKIVVAPMGVDTDRFCPPIEGTARSGVVYVGRLAEEKGVTHLLDAFALLLRQEPDQRLTVVGDGPLRAQLEVQAACLGIAARVTFAGARPQADIPAYFQRATLFAMPSLQEGLGLVAAEAMACGCPVVAHDIPGVQGLVVREETGLLVPPSDAAALAAAMLRILRDAGLAARIAAAGRRHVESQFSWSAVAARYRALYEGNRR
jgi:glycosyltransferase involved in cell wall biosynthesis